MSSAQPDRIAQLAERRTRPRRLRRVGRRMHMRPRPRILQPRDRIKESLELRRMDPLLDSSPMFTWTSTRRRSPGGGRARAQLHAIHDWIHQERAHPSLVRLERAERCHGTARPMIRPSPCLLTRFSPRPGRRLDASRSARAPRLGHADEKDVARPALRGAGGATRSCTARRLRECRA